MATTTSTTTTSSSSSTNSKTNQRHLGYLSPGNGHLAGRYSTPIGSREPTLLGVQGRPVTMSHAVGGELSFWN